MGSSIRGLNPRKLEALLVITFVLLPVKPDCVATLGVLTTNEESDLSFLLTGNVIVGTASGSLTFLLLKGKIFDRTSCKL